MPSFFAPGRINLIGEHIDYNGGLVLPACISLGIQLDVEPCDDGLIVLRSDQSEETITLGIHDDFSFKPHRQWANYPLSMFYLLQQQGLEIPAMRWTFSSSLPMGSGLSSSACIEVLSGFALAHMAGQTLDKTQLALLAQKAEREYIGMNCGIMDQFVIAQGKAEHALLLDCNTLDFEHIPLHFQDASLLILDTRKPRKLVESKYNERRAACDAALLQLQRNFGKTTLCAYSLAELEQLDWSDKRELYQRAKHAISEQARVVEARQALQRGDTQRFGQLLNASHQSLQQDYAVSGPELDTMVAAAQQHPACLGARMTGAGFGGCAIALVKTEAVESFSQQVLAQYAQIIHYEGAIYPVRIAGGVGLIDINS